MFADEGLARRILGRNRALAQDIGRVMRKLDPHVGETYLDLGDGYAIFAGDGSPLTQATGDFREAELEWIADFYRGRTAQWEAIVTPFFDAGAMNRLIARGAQLASWENLLYRPLSEPPVVPPLPPEIEIFEVAEDEMERWTEVMIEAFFGDGATPVLRRLAEIMAGMSDTRNYLGLWDGEPAAVARSSFGDSTAYLGGGATFPAYRRRGLQSALMARRLHDAVGHADLAIVGGLPGSSSQRNAERLGFRVAYTHASFMVKTEA